MNIDKVVTLEDIQLLIEDAHNAPINENGSSDMWDMLPRIPYKYLPDELKQVADKITVELAKKFLYECYPVGHFDKEAADPELIKKALHNARYLVESTEITPPENTDIKMDDWQPVSLIGSDLVEAWEKTTKGKTTKKSAEKKSMSANARLAIARGLAEAQGAIITTDGHVSSFSSDLLVNVFTSKNIYKLPDGTDKRKVFDDNGQLNTLAQPTEELQSLEEIHTAFLMDICERVRLTEDDGSHTIKVYLPGTDIDGRTYSKERIKETAEGEKIPAVRSTARINHYKNVAAYFDPLVGYTPNGSFYRVCAFLEYDAESETATLATPYLFKLKEMAESERPHHSAYNRLFHSNIINEPNKAAVELANRILNGVLNRGNTPDVQINRKRFMREHERQISLFDNEDMAAVGVDNKKITYRIKYTSLLEDCPQLTHILQEILDRDSKTKYQAYNSKLKQTFEQAYRIIMEKSDAPTYYEKFTLPGKYDKKGKLLKYITPTKSTLNSNLIIKHYGKRNATS